MDCLNNIIGITQNTCECFTGLLPEGYSTSTSGLYMDQLEEVPIDLKAVKSVADCGKGMDTLLLNARSGAVAEFKKDLFTQLAAIYKPKNPAFTGLIGKIAGSLSLGLSSAYAGVLLSGRMYKGAVLTLSKIHVNVTANATFDLLVYKQRRGETDSELVTTLEVVGTAAGVNVNTLSTPLSLPLWDETGKEINYFFLYELAGFQPKDNPVSCNCGLSEYNLKTYVQPKGVTGNDLSLMHQFNQTSYANGLVLEVDIRCGGEDIICQAMLLNEFVKVAIEWAILRKAVVNLINGILHSDNISRYNQARREQMYHDKGSLQKKYNNDVQWIAENMSMGLNDCYTCNDLTEPFTIGGIMS